jgi:hypothetical protein
MQRVNSLGHKKHAHNRYEGLECCHFFYSIEVVMCNVGCLMYEVIQIGIEFHE